MVAIAATAKPLLTYPLIKDIYKPIAHTNSLEENERSKKKASLESISRSIK